MLIILCTALLAENGWNLIKLLDLNITLCKRLNIIKELYKVLCVVVLFDGGVVEPFLDKCKLCAILPVLINLVGKIAFFLARVAYNVYGAFLKLLNAARKHVEFCYYSNHGFHSLIFYL